MTSCTHVWSRRVTVIVPKPKTLDNTHIVQAWNRSTIKQASRCSHTNTHTHTHTHTHTYTHTRCTAHKLKQACRKASLHNTTACKRAWRAHAKPLPQTMECRQSRASWLSSHGTTNVDCIRPSTKSHLALLAQEHIGSGMS